ncbi:sodium-dependent nutrient amino acid transporter 1-like [Ochlerotatus camptorhynchus]|uniref:sodium-dependent nutrient amino acid transporter 1-like n=1 Tax=Ochlerotatus camptorhynchus TaxID=644619 RepID=UPI0031CEF511
MTVGENGEILPLRGEFATLFVGKRTSEESQNLSNKITVSVYTATALSSSESSGSIREKWGKNIEFLLSCVALSVGFGNIWRFPYTALEHGGGSFLLPYLVVLFVVGRPLYYLEMIVGQFSSRGCVKVYDMCPLMRGVGVGQTITMFTIVGYYAAVLALAVRYFLASFQDPLPWSTCRADWLNCVNSNGSNLPEIHVVDNVTIHTKTEPIPSAQLYFEKTIVNKFPDLSNGIGLPSYQLVLCLLATWIVITVLLIKGIKSSGKASYFLAIFPYVILFGLLIRSVTLEGALKGIMYFITPQLDKLLDINVWYAAVTQCFFSLTIGLGAVIVYSSFNSFSNNIYRDAMIISWMDTVTSMLSGVIVFGVVGNLAHVTNREIDKVMKGGPELVFVVYPEAIAKMELGSTLFSITFFLMFILLGLGSNIGIVTTILTSIKDRYPKVETWKVVVGIALAAFCCGLIYISPGGLYMLDVVDYYGVQFPTLILVALEAFTFCWLYGVDRICLDIKTMLHIKTGLFWRVCWSIVSLGILLTITGLEFYKYEPKKYPSGYNIFGWCLFGFTVLQVVAWAIFATAKGPKDGICKNVVYALKPTADWGPETDSTKQEYDLAVMKHKQERKRHVTLRARLYSKIFK